MGSKSGQDTFFALLRAGLWAGSGELFLQDRSVDWEDVFRLSNEQAVQGLVLAGIERLPAEQQQAIPMLRRNIVKILRLEQRNNAMNRFIGDLIDRMREAGLRPFLVKGQGIAQCYERPLWRPCGDADFFLNKEDYEKAKGILKPLVQRVKPENVYSRHIGMKIGNWIVELHGSLRCGLSDRVDRNLDEIGADILSNGSERLWMDGDTKVLIPDVNNDAVYVFTHILKHFYKIGIGLRQICDWCRLLWKYRDEIDTALLEKRLADMGLVTEWKSFGALAVNYLGMPREAMPMFDESPRFGKKADRICSFVMEVGNFGHNKDGSYFEKPYVQRKAISFGRRCAYLVRHARIFPLSSIRFFPRIMINGFNAAARGA